MNPTNIINTTVYILLAILLIFPPLIHGGVEPWAVLTIHLITVFILFLWLMRGIIEKKLTLAKSSLDIPFLIFIIVCLVYTVKTVYPYGSFREFLKILNYIAIYYITVNFIKERKTIKIFTWIMIATGTCLASYGLYQYYSGITKMVSPSYICHNHFAGLMELCLPQAFSLIFLGETGLAVAGGILSVIMGFALIYSMSRGGWLAFLGAFIFMAFLLLYKKGYLNFRKKTTKLIFANIVVGVIVIISFTIPFTAKEKFAPLIKELEKGDDVSLSMRIPMWKGCLRVMEGQNYMGSGLGTFTLLYPQYKSFDEKGDWGVFVNSAHSDYLQLTIEAGIPGLAAFLFLLLIFYIKAFLYILYRPEKEGISPFTSLLIKKDQICTAGYMAAITGLVLHGVGDFNFQIPANNIYFFMIMGLAISNINITQHLRRELSEKKKGSPVMDFSGKKLVAFIIIASVIVGFFAFYAGRALVSKYYQKRGLSYERNLLWEKAIDDYETSVKIDPGNSYHLIKAGFTCSKLAVVDEDGEKWNKKAIEYYEKARDLNPCESSVYYYLANLYAEMGEEKKALEAFNKLVKLDPCNYRYRFPYGVYLQEKGEITRAIEQYEKYLLLRRDGRVEKILEELKAGTEKTEN